MATLEVTTTPALRVAALVETGADVIAVGVVPATVPVLTRELRERLGAVLAVTLDDAGHDAVLDRLWELGQRVLVVEGVDRIVRSPADAEVLASVLGPSGDLAREGGPAVVVCARSPWLVALRRMAPRLWAVFQAVVLADDGLEVVLSQPDVLSALSGENLRALLASLSGHDHRVVRTRIAVRQVLFQRAAAAGDDLTVIDEAMQLVADRQSLGLDPTGGDPVLTHVFESVADRADESAQAGAPGAGGPAVVAVDRERERALAAAAEAKAGTYVQRGSFTSAAVYLLAAAGHHERAGDHAAAEAARQRAGDFRRAVAGD
jgi:hypothetical protein